MKKISAFIFSILLTALWTRNVTAGDKILDSKRGPVFTGVMKDLSAHSITRRKHYNKHENVTEEQRYIDTVLSDRKRVDVKRYASVEEKDAILQILMASVLIDPSHQSLVTHETLKRYEASTDSLDRHFYIVGMTEYFSRKLRNQESIERSDYQTFERFSGVDFERFNRLFDGVKIKHMGGFHVELRDRKIEKRKKTDAQYGELSRSYRRKNIRQDLNSLEETAQGSSEEAKIALREIIEKAQSTDFSLQKWSIFTLFSIARGSSEQAKDALGALAKIAKTLDIVQKRKVVFQLGAIAEDSFVQAKTALDALIALANDTDDKRLQGLSVYQLGSVAEGSSEQAKRALEVLILIANTQGHEQQEYAVFQLGSVLRGSLTQGLAALDALTAIANDPKHAQNEKAVWQFAMGAQSKSPSIVQKARETLSTIARNPTHAQKEAAETELQALN